MNKNKKIAAVLYGVLALLTSLIAYPVVLQIGVSSLTMYFIIQIIAAVVFIKIFADLMDKKSTKIYGSSCFTVSVIFVVLTGLSYLTDMSLTVNAVFSYASMLKIDLTAQMADPSAFQTTAVIVLIIKLVLIAVAALYATMEEKEVVEIVETEEIEYLDDAAEIVEIKEIQE